MQVATRLRPRHLHRQDRALRSKHQELREKLNFRAIYPLLNEHRLLPYCDHSVLIIDGMLTEQARIDVIVDNLTKCNKENYLLEFIDCLKRSADGTRDGHPELAESLEAAYKAEAEDTDSDSILLQGEQIDRDSTCSKAAATETDVSHTKKNKPYLICGCVFIIPSLLMVIILLGILSNIPRVNNNPGSDMVRPLLTNRPRDGEQTRLLEVDFGTDPFWVSHADFQIEGCTGALLTIQGIQCNELPRKVIEDTFPSRNLYYAYLLPGSIVNITVADTMTNSEDPVQVWMLNSEGWKLTDLGENLGSCNDPPSGSTCFLAQSKAGQIIQQEIEKADFYFYFTDRLSNMVRFTYTAEQYLYNITEIRQVYSPTETAIIRDRSQTITITPSFDFQQRKCIMLSSSCPSTQSHAVTIGNLKRRMDILLFPGVGGIIVLLVAISLLSVYSALIAWPRLKKKYRSKIVVGTTELVN